MKDSKPHMIQIEMDALNTVIEENDGLKKTIEDLHHHIGVLGAGRTVLKIREKNLCSLLCCVPETLEDTAARYIGDLRSALKNAEDARDQVSELEAEIKLRRTLARDKIVKSFQEAAEKIPAGVTQLTVDTSDREDLQKKKLDAVYAERNMLVSLLSKVFPSVMKRHPEDQEWEDDWRWIVFIDLPTGQATFHLHDSHLPWFSHLNTSFSVVWDGHTTEEKYKRVMAVNADAVKFSGSAVRKDILDDVAQMLVANPLPYCVGNSCAKDCATAVALVRDGFDWHDLDFRRLLLDAIERRNGENRSQDE